MKRYKQYIRIATAVAMLLAVGCQQAELIERNEPDTGELKFSPNLGEPHTATRAGESDNNVLQIASAAGPNSPHIVIQTYTGTPGTSLNLYFSEELGYFKSGNYWDINSGTTRFLPSGGMNLYAYFATTSNQQADLANIDYIHPVTVADHPKLTFTVATDDALSQVDLIAAKVEGITHSDVAIPLRHILSQINFGVKGIDQHQITVKNIRINKVMGNGSFDYNTWLWTPNAKAPIHNYPYYYPDRKKGEANSGLGGNYKTRGTLDDSRNSYIFGDGGKFGSGNDTTFLYAQADHTVSDYATKDNTPAPLRNSLMLLPQQITNNADATVTFDYEIKLGDRVVRSGTNNEVRLDTYYDWKPNYRYIYIFKFDDPQKVEFDVFVEPWQNYNDGDGIVGTDELNSTNLFQKYVSPLMPGANYTVPLGALTADFICDWSLYMQKNSFTAGQTFSLTFDNNLPFVNGKSVIINPPFGFKASATSLKAPGTVTFTASPYSYYSTSTALNSAISSGSGNYEFTVSDAIKLNEINFTGSTTAESSLTLHYLTAYTDGIPSRWGMYDPKTAVCYPKDYALTTSSAPYAYTIYTVQGLKAVLDWMNGGGANPGGNNSGLQLAERMQTNITLTARGRFNLAEVYKASATDLKPPFVPIGNNSTPYTGNFDGKGATVENLYINSADQFQGFFGDKRGLVQNLNLANVSVTGGNFVGAIAGLNGGGNIINCTVSGKVTGNDIIGGIAGANWSYIIGCGSAATIYGGTPGGIAGNGGFITACYSTGDVTGWGNVGGIAANGGTTTACYSTSTLGGSGNKGGIAGYGGTTNSCYYIAASDIGTHPAGVTRLPSVAVLNGKIPYLNSAALSQYATVHFVSGNLDVTSPTIAAGAPAPRAGGGTLSGTFIQNWFALYWDQTRWDEEMAVLASVGMQYLVIDQVMEFSDFGGNNQYMAWYPASQSVLVNDPTFFINFGFALEKCMTACRAHGIKIFIGTFFDKRYWDGGAAVKGKEAQWNNCITTANRVMNELSTFYFNGASSTKGNFTDVLAGWYFPYEVDDLNFQTSAAQTTLKNGIATAMTYRNNHANSNVKKPYLFSPFMNGSGSQAIGGTMNAAQYAALWADIIKNSGGFKTGDILSPQDCIGIEKLTLADIPTWMSALKGATANGVEFWINIELFGPGGDATFLTTQQIRASKAYAAKLISFSYPIYYSPNIGNSSGHKAYKAYYDAQ